MMSKTKKTAAKREIKPQPVKISALLKKRFEIPASFLKQLREFSDGGFILITQNQGEPVVQSYFDTSMQAMAFTKFCADYFGIMENNITNVIGQNFMGRDQSDDMDSGPINH